MTDGYHNALSSTQSGARFPWHTPPGMALVQSILFGHIGRDIGQVVAYIDIVVLNASVCICYT